MNTPKANQSTNEIEVLIGSNAVFSADDTEFTPHTRWLEVYGQQDIGSFLNIALTFFPPDMPAQVKKGDVYRVSDIQGVHLNFNYRFESPSTTHVATDGHLTVEEIDLSVPLFKGRFEFSGPHSGDVGHFHGRFSVRG